MSTAQRNFLTGSFNPMSLSPALWLDASDASTLYDATVGGNLVPADGAVARWEDKSGNLRHAIQSTSADRPLRKTNVLNGRGALLFDGSTDKLVSSLDISTNFSIVVVARRNSGTSACCVAGNLQNSGNIDGILIGHFYAGSNNDCAAALTRISASVAETSRVNVSNNAFIASTIIQPSSYTGWINGGKESTVSASYTSRDSSFTIGSPRSASNPGESINGNIFEVLIFPRVLSTTERLNVEAYLKNKWMPDFNPISLSPALWLSDTGNDAAVWSDISGNGRNATQGTPSQQPTIVTNVRNGRQIRRFNGTNQRLDVATLDPKTIFAVVNTTTTSTYRSVFGSRSSDTGPVDAVYFQAGTPTRTATFARATVVDTIGGSDLIATAGVIGSGVWSIISGVRTDTSIQAFLNGVGGAVDTTVNALKNTTASVVGAAYYNDAIADFWPGDIAEIIIFTTTLSTTDRLNVEAYLRAKWSTP
jgi:hypothetical protein